MDPIVVPAVIVLAYFAIALLAEFIFHLGEARSLCARLIWAALALLGLFAFAAASLFLQVIYRFIGIFIDWLDIHVSHAQFVFVATACAVGSILFVIRRKARSIYGLIEIVTSWAGLSLYPKAPTGIDDHISAPLAAWLLGLLGLIYIFVRGLDNYWEGAKAMQARDNARQAANDEPNKKA